MPRPHKFTDETVKRLLYGLRQKMSYEHCAQYAGIDYLTFLSWRKGDFPTGSKPRKITEEMKQDFLDQVTRAEGEGLVRSFQQINRAAETDWRAAAWLLERRYYDTYGRRNVEITGKGGGPIRHEHEDVTSSLADFSDDEIAQLAALAAKRRAGMVAS